MANSNKILTDDTLFGIKEAYNMARTNIMYLNNDSKCPVYGITSAIPHEGKSLTAANIAISFAKMGKKVLLVDCDMRLAVQSATFAAKVKAGLSEYLAGIRNDLVVQKTKHENLFLITAGKIPPNPSELLNNQRMKELIAHAREEYDYVFLDFPPIIVVSDATALVEEIDGYIMVVRAGISDARFISDALNTMNKINAKVVGFVFNCANPKSAGRTYKKEYKKYKYGSYSKYGSYAFYGDKYDAATK